MKCQIECIAAHHADWCNCNSDRTGTIVGIGKDKVWADAVSGNDLFMRKLCKQPDLPAALQTSCGFVTDTFP